jgi:hypothetical protein
MKKPVLEYDSRGESGNIFWILGQVRRILQKQSRITAYNEMWEKVQNTHSYNEALEIIGKEVTLIDTAK